MKYFFPLISSEFLKLKRTLALWMILLAPLLVILLQCFIWLNQKEGIGYDADLWLMFTNNILSMWAIFMFPLVCALILALVYHYEHANAGWLKMYSLPVPRWMIMVSKIITSLLLMAGSYGVVIGGSVAAAFAVDALHPNISMPSDIPIGTIVERAGSVWAATMTVFAIQNFVSWRWTTLSVPIGVGITGTFLALFASSWKYGYLFPWLTGVHALFKTADIYPISLWGGFGAGIIILIGTVFSSVKRDLV